MFDKIITTYSCIYLTCKSIEVNPNSKSTRRVLELGTNDKNTDVHFYFTNSDSSVRL